MIYSAVPVETKLEYQIIGDPNSLPPILKNYWKKRTTFFPNFDKGYLTDEEGLYSVTPYEAANTTAIRFKNFKVVVDAFCGIGGNAIALAKVCEKVIAIDIVEERIEIAKHNARLEGVLDKIEFICGDCLDVIPKIEQVDAIFGSPPWNILTYRAVEMYSLDYTTPSTFTLYEVWRKMTPNLAFMLPRKTSVDELQSLGEIFEIQHFNEKRNGKTRVQFVCVYFGKLINYV